MKFPRVGRAVYRNPQWAAVRLLAKRRDDFACVQCGARGRIEVDHIAALRDGGAAFDLDNLQCLCPACHTKKTRIEVGHPEKSPARETWDIAVAELAAGNPQAKGTQRA